MLKGSNPAQGRDPHTWISLHKDLEAGMNAFCLGIEKRLMWQVFKYLKMKLEVLCEFNI